MKATSHGRGGGTGGLVESSLEKTNYGEKRGGGSLQQIG
jgi:hypothetical protein